MHHVHIYFIWEHIGNGSVKFLCQCNPSQCLSYVQNLEKGSKSLKLFSFLVSFQMEEKGKKLIPQFFHTASHAMGAGHARNYNKFKDGGWHCFSVPIRSFLLFWVNVIPVPFLLELPGVWSSSKRAARDVWVRRASLFQPYHRQKLGIEQKNKRQTHCPRSFELCATALGDFSVIKKVNLLFWKKVVFKDSI